MGQSFWRMGQTVRRGEVCYTPKLHSGDPEFKYTYDHKPATLN